MAGNSDEAAGQCGAAMLAAEKAIEAAVMAAKEMGRHEEREVWAQTSWAIVSWPDDELKQAWIHAVDDDFEPIVSTSMSDLVSHLCELYTVLGKGNDWLALMAAEFRTAASRLEAMIGSAEEPPRL